MLIYIEGQGAIACTWYAHPGEASPDGRTPMDVKIPQLIRVRLEPGLSFCPGDRWEHVSRSPSFVKGKEEGKIRPVAGHGGDLAGEWAKLRPRAITTMVGRSSHVEALKRVEEIERKGPQRTDVLEVLEGRFDDLQVQVDNYNRERRDRRRSHRRR